MLSKSEYGCGFWAGFVPIGKKIDAVFQESLLVSLSYQSDIQDQSDSLYDCYSFDTAINAFIQPCCPVMKLHSQFNLATISHTLDNSFFTHVLNDEYGARTIFLLNTDLINQLIKITHNSTPTSEYIGRMLQHCYKVNQKFPTRTFIVLESFGDYQPTIEDFDWDNNVYIHQMFHDSNYLFCHHQVVDYNGDEWSKFPLDEYELTNKSPDYNYPYRRL
jgi:hypothetical protein